MDLFAGSINAHSHGTKWAPPLSLADLNALIDAQFLIEPEAVSESIRRGDEAWLRDLDASYNSLREAEIRLIDAGAPLALKAVEEWRMLDDSFHCTLTNACGSLHLAHLRHLLFQQASRYQRELQPNHASIREAHADHEAIVCAAKRRDVARACNLMSAHLHRAAEQARALLYSLTDGAPTQPMRSA